MSSERPQAVEVVVAADEVDLVSGLLWGAGVSAIGEATRLDGRVVLTTDLPPIGTHAIDEVLRPCWTAAVVEVLDDGLDRWRPYAEVVPVGRHLVVQPPWVPYGPAPGEIVVAIDPGRSFGHGAHPTTRSCLAALERLVRPGCSVLDVGCGSGVLAVTAARLGAGRVVAVDIEAAAIIATRANAALNEVSIEVSDRPVQDCVGPFDLILANIGAATLVVLAAPMAAHLVPGGRLVLSGLLAERPGDAVAAFEELEIVGSEVVEGWLTVVLSHRR